MRAGIGDFGVCVCTSSWLLQVAELFVCVCVHVCLSACVYLLCVEQLVEFDRDYREAKDIFPAR